MHSHTTPIFIIVTNSCFVLLSDNLAVGTATKGSQG